MDTDNINPDPADETAGPDISVYEAKIAELEAALVAKDGEIAAIQAELSTAKAHNYDLLMGAATNAGDSADDSGDDDADSGDTELDIDDLFEDGEN